MTEYKPPVTEYKKGDKVRLKGDGDDRIWVVEAYWPGSDDGSMFPRIWAVPPGGDSPPLTYAADGRWELVPDFFEHGKMYRPKHDPDGGIRFEVDGIRKNGDGHLVAIGRMHEGGGGYYWRTVRSYEAWEEDTGGEPA